ncbi:MAG TPA: oxygenase MpaB family protein [Nocardioides sp.]|uniref:oxygenase MpaB family protein n=1 Tax=Nocardioides sp. TaxID=35761 RepID=UPI002D7E9F71|nr:oxygenase MpaB family protein [Nocardioides sp.]HET6654599.1 oxygenase MpaB family protein [Nocardioides sp.]
MSPGTTSARDPQKRYDDTALLLDEISVHGLHSDGGRRAIRRINQMHGSYAIADDDMRYVLARFVVVPKRWMDDYGWRRFTDVEVEASIRYYRELGRPMGIKRLPQTYDGFERLLDDYEATHFRYDEAGRRVADMTLALLRSLPPGRGRPGGRVLPRPDGRAAAHRVRLPCAAGPGVRAARAALRLRGRLERLPPARRTPVHARDLPRIRSYPGGFDVDGLGTFPRGCPVPHRPPDAIRRDVSAVSTTVE